MFFKGLGWASVVLFGFISIGLMGQGAWFGAILLVMLAVIFVPSVFTKIETSWKAEMEAKQGVGAGAFSRPFAAHSMGWVLAIVILVSNLAPQGNDFDTASDHIKRYSILKQDDVSFPGRKRMSYFIVANERMASPDDYAFTARKAAQDFVLETGADVVTVFLEIDEQIQGRGLSVSIVNYFADGKGYSGNAESKVWSTSAASNPPSKKELNFWREFTKRMKSVDDLDSEAENNVLRAMGFETTYVPWYPNRENFSFGG